MKKLHRVCLVLTIALCIVAQSGSALGKFSANENSIAVISQENMLWKAEYVNSRNETIAIDVAVQTPAVDQLPVIKVTPYPKMRDDFQLLFQDPKGKMTANWSSYIADEYASGFHNWEHGLEVGENPTKMLIEYEYIPTAALDWSKAYAENNTLPFGEAFDHMETVLKQLCEEYGSGNYYPMDIESVEIKSIPRNKNGELLRQHGAYTVNCHQTMDNIPILMNVSECFSNSRNSDRAVPRGYFWSITSLDSYFFTMALLEKESVLHDDIPILGFESIRPAIEELIQKSRIRNVYSVRLGFVVFMEKSSSRTSLVMVPSWVVGCEYYDNAKQETATLDEGVEFYKQTKYRKLIFNAQTGELIDPNSKDGKRSVAPKILTWK